MKRVLLVLALILGLTTLTALSPLSPGSVGIPLVGSAVEEVVAIDDAQALGSCSYSNFHEVVWISPQFYYVCTFGSDGWNWGWYWQLQYCASCGGGCMLKPGVITPRAVSTASFVVRYNVKRTRTQFYEPDAKEPQPLGACM